MEEEVYSERCGRLRQQGVMTQETMGVLVEVARAVAAAVAIVAMAAAAALVAVDLMMPIPGRNIIFLEYVNR